MKNLNLLNRLFMDSHEKQSPQRFARCAAMLIMLLTLGVGQMWAGTYTVVGVAMDNDYPRISLNSGGGENCGWWTWFIDGNKAGITYEGKKLYVPNWTDCWNGTDAMYFQAHSDKTGDNQTSYNTVHDSYTEVANYNHKIYNYNASSTSGAWYDFVSMKNGAKVYFDASNWSETNIKLVTGHAAHQKYYSMSHVANTKLYYGTNTDVWDDAVGFGVVGGSDRTGGNDQSLTDVSAQADEYTGWKRQGLTSTGANNAYLCVNAGKAGQQPTVSYNDSYTTLLNSTQTIESYVSTDYGSSYSKANSKATITITSYAMTAQGASGATASNGSLSTSANSTTVTSARTATTTLSVGTVADGYVFVGWFNSSNSLLSTETSYTYYPTGATTVRARFKNEVSHVVTISNYCTTNSTTISSSSRGIGESTSVNITAPSINDHTYVNWTLGNGMTNHSANLSANPISVTTDGAGSTYTMRANYTLKTCSISVCTTSNASGDGTKYLMSYNYTENAYYYDMASSPANLYFRFVHADGGKWSGNWNGSAPNVYNVDANGDKVTCNTNVSGWDDKATLHFSGLTGSPIRIWFDFQNKKAWITEATYAVSFNNGDHGTVSPSGSQSIGKNSGKSITATPNTGWKFVNWTKTGSAVLSSTTTNPTTVTATGTGSVTPTYAHRFVLRGSIKADGDPAGGMAGWSANDNSSYASASISDGVMTITANLTKAKTQYKCMIRDLVNDSYKGLSTSSDIGSNSPQTLSGSSDFWFTTTCAGTYTFTYDVSKNTLKVVFPTSYTITYEVVGGTGGTMTATVSGETVGTSPGKAEAGSTVRFSASPSSGYEFTKWVDGSGSQLSTSNPYDVSSLAADKTVKAVFTAITYNSGVLKKNGGDEDGSYSVTYMGTSITPSAPTKTGYHVDGYYAEAGTSTHIATAAGVLQNNKSGYTDATGHWNYAGVKDLYAKWAANTYTAANNIDGDGGSNGQYTATYDATSIAINTAPTRTGYNLTGFHAYGRSANSLANSSGTLTASQSEARDKDAKTLTDASNHWIYDGTDAVIYADWSPKTYDITLDQEGGASGSTSVTMTYDASTHTAITNPTKTGYTFGGYWTGDNGTGTMVIATDGTLQANVDTYTGDGGIWKKDATCTLYAKWTPNNYAVTLSTTSETGYGSNAPANQTATYGAAMPTITPPVGAPGYKFQGYFTAANGGGDQYYNANGTSAQAWDIASATTLHAHFQKTVISTLEHPASIAKGDVITLDVNPVLNQTGATNYMDICWSLLYDNDNPVESGVAVAANPVDGKPNQVRYTLTGLSAGYYQVKAVLKANASSFDACSTGTELSTFKSNLRIAGNSNVTILYQDASGNTIRENGAVEVARGETVGVKAPTIVGYTFSSWTLGDVLSNECASSASCGTDKDSINISAEYDGHLTAKYNRKNTIYFKNTLGWPAVYVNLLTEGYWASDGSGNKDKSNRNIAMTQIGTSDVWYYEYDNKTTSAYVSFTSISQENAEKFWGADTEVEDDKAKVVYPTRPNYDANERTAYGFNVNTPMFVPLAGQTAKELNKSGGGSAFYYNQGYWAKYEPVTKQTGYTLNIYNKKNNDAEPDAGSAPVLVKSVPFVFDGDMTFPVSVTVDLEAGKWYGFKLYRDKGNSSDPLSWYGNSNNMSNQHSGDFSKGETAWEFKTTLTANCGLKTNSAGDYVFTLTYGKEAYADSMQYLIGVHYPEATGDYRIVYSDDNRTGILSTTIPYDSEKDTLSFFINKDANPVLKMQKCEVSYSAETSTVEWTDTIANLFSGGLPSSITKNGVYYICINRNEDGKKELGDVKLYTGNFYIRTDGATPSKWDNFRQNNHLMAYSEYADKHENFTHSWTQWYDLTYRRNLKFTVANDYSVSISDTLIREALSGQWTNIDDYIDENGDLNRQANVRFMYDEKTNAISRAYIDGAYADGGNFLKILARTQDSIYAAAEGGDPLTEITFTDNGNWLYEQTVFAQPGARYKLRSLFGTTEGGKHVITQYFKGGSGATAADSATIIGGTGSSRMQIRLIYDFKTNRVVTAYQPSGTINDDLEIHADIMFMREHQGDIEQITFAEGKSISEIENIYCGLRFNKWTLNNKSKEDGHATLSPLLSRYERDIFYVSFPYDVRLSDVIGFGTYGQHWIVEYYDGASRAAKGFWIDSDTYWKFVTPAMKDTFTLKAGTGYIVALDLDELYYINESLHASIWDNTDITNLELLFPGKVSSISEIDVTYNVPKHTCTINRGDGTSGDRRVKDSHWNVLGVPTFKNITGADSEYGGGSGAIVFANTAWIKDSMDLKFIYDGNLADNSLTPKAVKGFEFKAMHAYVVQYGGNVTFTTSATPAPAIVARRTYADKPQDVDFRLELNKNGVMEDQTFVSLSNDENASADFVFGEDMSKEFNANRANIYTFIGTEWVAGNTLPMINQTTIVPVGVKTAAEGEYTFSIPEGTYGVGIVLIDNIAGTRTNLGLMDYTVTLGQGQIDNRFLLEISPIQQTPTDVENVQSDNVQGTKVRKVMIDGLLYIVKDGKVYDAQGKRVQ